MSVGRDADAPPFQPLHIGSRYHLHHAAAPRLRCPAGTNDCSAGARSSSSEARRPRAAGASLAPNYRRPGRKPCGGEALVSVARCYVGIAYALRCRKCSVIKQNCP